MKESEAKKKRCCGPSGCGTTKPPTKRDEPEDAPTVINARRWCTGSKCMGWDHTGSVNESHSKDSMGDCGLKNT